MPKDSRRSLAGDPLLRLVDRIYGGAVDAHAWPEIVREVVGYVGGTKGLLFTSFIPPKRGGLGVAFGTSDANLQRWGTHYIKHDLWAQAGLAKGLFREGKVVLDAELVPEREFVQSVIYRELLEPDGIGRMCAGVVFGLDSVDMPPTICGVYRAIGDAGFGKRERGLMHTLVPHLSRALGVMFRLRDAEFNAAANLAALDRLAPGVVLLDEEGAVAHVNHEAKRMLEAQDGLALGAGGTAGALLAEDAAAQGALERALGSVLDSGLHEVPHFSTTVQAPRPSGRRPFVLQFAPLPAANGFSGDTGLVRAIVFVTEQDQAVGLDPKLLRRLYDATPAEARLADRICAGDTLVAAAEHCGIAEQTARNQLQSLFEKTGTHRQADLVRLLVSLASVKA